MTSVEIIITGQVQGVGFRQYVQEKANLLKIKGSVKNTYTGQVKINAEGEKSDITALIDYCKIGSALSNVERVDIQSVYHIGYTKFEIKH